MPLCPQGHDSEWSDFCSVCGVAMPSAAGASGDPGNGGLMPPPVGDLTPPPAGPTPAGGVSSGESCPSCGYARTPDDVFCESCGYDFQSGKLPTGPTATPAPPDPAAGPTPAPPDGGPGPDPSLDPAAAAAATPGAWWVVVEADPAYFDRFYAGGPVTFPTDPAAPVSIPLLSDVVTIGRRSRSRGINPDIDASGPPEDPAVSHRHATLERSADGGYAVVDRGSTNGTRINDEEDELARDLPRALQPGDRVYVGAWTRITLERR